METEAAVQPGFIEWAHRWIEYAAGVVDILAAVVIIVGMTVGTLGFLAKWQPRAPVPAFLRTYRDRVGNALLLALELLIASDVLETIVRGPGLQELAGLALLVVLRTFLSWSLELELEHRWPWQAPPPLEELHVAERVEAGLQAERSLGD
jgi:uncharacterized membrane protein